MGKPVAVYIIGGLFGFLFLAGLITGAAYGSDLVSASLSLYAGITLPAFYRTLTYAFVHSGFFHLFFNFIVFYFTAKPLEEEMGSRNMALLFCGAAWFCGLFTLLHLHLAPWAASSSVLGASGAISAFLYLYWRRNPDATMLLFFVVPVPIRYMMVGLIALDLAGTLFPLRTGLAHSTHLAGYLFGWLYLRYGNAVVSMADRLRDKRHLRLTINNMRKEQEIKDYYREQIDPILKKISEQGIESLTDIEKHILKKAKELKK